MGERFARWLRAHRSTVGLALGLLALVAVAASALPAAMAAAVSSPEPSSLAASAPPGGEPAPAVDASPSVEPSPGVDPSPSVDPSPLPAITCALGKATVVYGAPVTVSGAVTPAGEGHEVVVMLDGVDVATALTDADGLYSLAFTSSRGGAVSARLADGTVSPTQALAVQPKVTIAHGTAYPFLTLTYTMKVEPASYTGAVATGLWHNGSRLTLLRKSVSTGRVVFALPMRGVGSFTVRTQFSAQEGLAARRVEHKVRAAGRTLAVGSKGPHVRGLLTALNRLKIRVPYIGSTLSRNCGDSVVAFQKAYRLPRKYVFDADDWKRLDTAKPVRPRYSKPYDHLEVDKTRQILMMVRNGSLRALIAISSGATGNTPEGSFRIQQKHSFTTSGYGGILFRTMGFYGNFAIHGYVPVPPYPASHGCVREPMWVADWIYDRTALGERLYIYR